MNAPAERFDRAAVEQIVAGAIYDFAAYLTMRPDVLPFGASADAAPMAERVVAWAKDRDLTLAAADIENWRASITGVDPQEQPSATFDVGDVYAAYVAGAHSGAKHHEADTSLFDRAADAYVKQFWRCDPTTGQMQRLADAPRVSPQTSAAAQAAYWLIQRDPNVRFICWNADDIAYYEKVYGVKGVPLYTHPQPSAGAVTEAMEKALRTAASTFFAYAALHQAKGTPEGIAKAAANRTLGQEMVDALTAAREVPSDAATTEGRA